MRQGRGRVPGVGHARALFLLVVRQRHRLQRLQRRMHERNDPVRRGRAPDVRRGDRRLSDVVGERVPAHGDLRRRDAMRELLRDIRFRARRTARAQQERGSGWEETGRAVCAALNSAFEEEGSLFRQRSAGLLLRAVTHRPQLDQIDHQAARAVLKAVTGVESVRAFRRVPYRKIRAEWGLKSLLHARNKRPPGPA